MQTRQRASFVQRMLRHLIVLTGAASLTTLFFLVLPLIQAITEHAVPDTLLTSVDTANLPPPPPAAEDEPEEEDEPEDTPPELTPDSQPLDLAQMELVLNPGYGGAGGGTLAVDFGALAGAAASMDDFVDMSGLDQKPRPIYQPGPQITPKLRKIKSGGTVKVRFVVSERGKVVRAWVEASTDSRFDKAAVDAVKKWKYEPGKRKGKPSEFRLTQALTFPKQG